MVEVVPVLVDYRTLNMVNYWSSVSKYFMSFSTAFDKVIITITLGTRAPKNAAPPVFTFFWPNN